MGDFYEKLLGLDIPVLIPLPRDLVASGQFQHWNASTVHKLVVKTTCGNSFQDETSFVDSFPVVIKLYDTLPLYRQFNEPLVETRNSSNNQVLVELSLPVTAMGPGDEFSLDTTVMTNASYHKISKKLRLKEQTLQIKEILECHEGGLPARKVYKLFTQTANYLETLLTTNGIKKHYQIAFPLENDYLNLYASQDAMSLDASINYPSVASRRASDKVIEGVPLTHTQGFTTLGRLFSIRYEAILKLKMAHCKDMEICLPITVSPYNKESSDYILRWIMKECEVAKIAFGKDTIHRVISARDHGDMVRALKGFTKPPILYRHTKTDWVRLGFNIDAFGRNDLGKNLVNYID